MDLKGNAYFGSVRRACPGAFTIIELLVVVAVIFVLMGLLAPARAKSRSETHGVIDLSNVHQILQAVHIYASENNDFMPHSTWGTVSSGPTGWLYAKGMPSAMVFNQSQVDGAMSNQVSYFRKGQLAHYVGNNQKIFECPTDVDQRQSGNFKTWYLQRQVKLSSYGFAGAISGFGAPKQAPNADAGGTYKLSQFWPTSFLMREPDETVPFNFNDAGDNQENLNEAPSLRHAARAGFSGASGLSAVVLRGAFGGDGAYIPARTFTKLHNAPAENDLRCGPGYR